jgi:adenine-specific DNA-methyltransferase
VPVATSRRARAGRRSEPPVAGRAAAVWRAACARYGVDPHDVRLAACAPDLLDVAPDEHVPDVAGAAAWLGEEHLAGQDPALRSREGRFYTPPLLSRCLAEQVWPYAQGEGIAVDPACGSGALLVALVDHALTELSPAAAVRWVVDRVRGTDLDEGAVRICNLAIAIAVLPAWAALDDRARPTLPVFAELADGLADRRRACVVLANPPFGRVTLSAAEREPWSDVLYGHAHRPTLFLAAAVRRLSPGGAAAFVLPASLVGGAYYQKLRAFLLDEAPPAWLAFVADREGVFRGGVLQESLLGVFARRGGSELRPVVERIAINGAVHRAPLSSARISGRGRAPWLLPRETDDGPRLVAAEAMTHRLADYGWRVSTGPLVWNRHRHQLHRERGPRQLPVIWAGDIEEGAVRLSPRRTLRWCTVEPGQEWLVLDRPALLLQRTTAPEQPRRLVGALLDASTLRRLGGRVVVENHLNVCTCEGDSELTPDRLYTFLSSDLADRLYRCLTGSVAVSAYELGSLPLPRPGGWDGP